MTWNMKYHLKKCIAIVLAVAVVAGGITYYGRHDATSSVQAGNLPGIEEINQDSSIFHILEVVPDGASASIGYLIGGEEPVKDGKKLSELPSAYERKQAMANITQETIANFGSIKFTSYTDGSGDKTMSLLGRFLKNESGEGAYNYVSAESTYRLYDAVQDASYTGKRYNYLASLGVFASESGADSLYQVTLAKVTGETASLTTNIITNGTTVSPNTVVRYNVTTAEQPTSIESTSEYAGKQLWMQDAEKGTLTYLGYLKEVDPGETTTPATTSPVTSTTPAASTTPDASASPTASTAPDTSTSPTASTNPEGTVTPATTVTPTAAATPVETSTEPGTVSEDPLDLDSSSESENGVEEISDTDSQPLAAAPEADTNNTNENPANGVATNDLNAEDTSVDSSNDTTTEDSSAVPSGSGNSDIPSNGESTLQEETEPSQEVPDTDTERKNLVLVTPSGTTEVWATWNGTAYTVTPKGDAVLIDAGGISAVDGETYYLAAATSISGYTSGYQVSHNYVEAEDGAYVLEASGEMEVIYREEEGFDGTKDTYDFVGDYEAGSVGSFTYSGGFENEDWFKKAVLGLSDVSAKTIEVSTITVSDLNELATEMFSSYADIRNAAIQKYGIDLTKVDLIYLSGLGVYSGLSGDDVTSAATAIARMSFGYGMNRDESGNLLSTRSDSTRVPTIIDYQFYQKNANGGNDTLARLALALLTVSDESDASAVKGVLNAGTSYWSSATLADLQGKVNAAIGSNASAQGVENASNYILGMNLYEYLTDNVYLNDDRASVYAGKDYQTGITDTESAKRTWIYSSVLNEISYQNFLNESNQDATKLDEIISKATITRYILNWYQHRTQVKSEIKVLDLEPCYDFDSVTDLQNDIKSWMGYTESYKATTISVTQMASTEFIGKVEDINASYDLIYLGAHTGTMNVDDNGKTVFNDTGMNGMIYYHTGDKYSYSTESLEDRRRMQGDDYISDISNNVITYGKSWDDVSYRGPGNDMNSTKFDELKQYVEAGYALVIADDFLEVSDGKVVASKKTMDSNSYFYRLVNEVVLAKDGETYKYWQRNVFAESQLEEIGETATELVMLVDASASGSTTLNSRRNLFCNYLNLSKLTMTWVSGYGDYCPTPLSYSNEGVINTYLSKIDGENKLQFIFQLSNDAALSQSATNYDCRLYIDQNADGRFEGSEYSTTATSTSVASEELTALKVYELVNSEWKEVGRDGDVYRLMTGKAYKVVRSLPDSYVGAIPWKLVFYDNNNRLVRTAETGYTAVQAPKKQEIKVLQLMPWTTSGENSTGTWNLQNELTSTDSLLYQYVSNLTDYDIQIDSKIAVAVGDKIENEFAYTTLKAKGKHNYSSYAMQEELQQTLYEALKDYNLLILGFDENYLLNTYTQEWQNIKDLPKQSETIISNALCWAIRDYIEDGRSVIFTHDTTSYVNSLSSYYNIKSETNNGYTRYWYQGVNSNAWGYEINMNLRSVLGLDRYNDTESYFRSMGQNVKAEALKQTNTTDQAAMETQSSAYYSYADSLKELNTKGYFDTIKEPGTSSELTTQTEGFTKYAVVRYMTEQIKTLMGFNTSSTSNTYFPVRNATLKQIGFSNSSWTTADDGGSNFLNGTYAASSSTNQHLKATEVNAGQITQYPYQITKKDQKDIEISSTHYQWYQLNVEQDADGDGKNDIVVWYTLSDVANNDTYTGKNIYSVDPKDVVNNYYLYTMNNVTYSGIGHTKPDTAAEVKLFINTMVTCFESGMGATKVAFVDDSGNETESLYMLYDAQNKLVLNMDASDIVSMHFVATDDNIIGGSQQTYVEFYKECEAKTEGAIDADTLGGAKGVYLLPLTPESVTTSAGIAVSPSGTNTTSKASIYPVDNGGDYILNYKISEMGLFSGTDEKELVSTASASSIYVRAYTTYDDGKKSTNAGFAELTISAQRLFELK